MNADGGGASNIRLKPNPLWKSSCGFSRRVGEQVAKLVRVSSLEGLTTFATREDGMKAAGGGVSNIRLKPNPLCKSSCGFSRRVSEARCGGDLTELSAGGDPVRWAFGGQRSQFTVPDEGWICFRRIGAFSIRQLPLSGP
jgi:hypothetical protein